MKNQRFLEKGLALLPEVKETEVAVARTVKIQKDGEHFQIRTEKPYWQETLKKGTKICLDFGDHQVGYLKMKLGYVGSHPDAPVWMRLHFAENPAELFENAETYAGWICSSWIEEEQIHIDTIPAEVNLPRRYAFRYVEIEILDISSKFELTMEQASCTAVTSAEDSEKKDFPSEDPQLKRMDQIACRTLRNCMQTVFEDGPKRDRRLWIGDLRIQALANYETYQKNDMVKACLYLFAALPMQDGRISACLFLEPEPEADDTQMFDYSLFFVNILWDYYRETGDKETLQELWPTAKQQIQLAEQCLDTHGIVEDSDVLGWCFVDWNLHLNKQASAQGILLYAIQSGIQIAQAVGDTAEESRLKQLYQQCKESANRYLWSDAKQCYLSGSDGQISMASQVWMVLGGAVEKRTAAGLLQRTESNPEAVKMVTPYMYHNYIDALIGIGEKKAAKEKMQQYWGGMLDQNADTFWELYNPENVSESPYGGTIVNSYCHAWSCGPAYFLRKYFGGKEETK